MQQKNVLWLIFSLTLALFFVQTVSASEAKQKLFAIVDGYEITESVYLRALQTEAKKRYYHGRITEERLAELEREVAQNLIDQVLLIHEAEKIGLTPDKGKIDAMLEAFDQRYTDDEQWQKDRDVALPALRKQFESKALVEMIEKRVREDITLTESMKQAFYNENPDLFLLPERRKVSLILVKVSPSALSKTWQEAKVLLEELSARILAGESFSALAQKYSDDQTASQGGDMGYQHKGMLHSDVEKVLDDLTVGELSQPIRLLQGYALVRLEHVLPAKKISYQASEEQVTALLFKKRSDKKWDDFLKKIRNNASVLRF